MPAWGCKFHIWMLFTCHIVRRWCGRFASKVASLFAADPWWETAKVVGKRMICLRRRPDSTSVRRCSPACGSSGVGGSGRRQQNKLRRSSAFTTKCQSRSHKISSSQCIITPSIIIVCASLSVCGPLRLVRKFARISIRGGSF